MGLQDDAIYLGLLLASIAFGVINRQWLYPGSSPSLANHRRLASTLFGLAVLVVVAGRFALYPIVAYALQVILLMLVPWRCLHVVSFVAQFTFLLFFRVAPWMWPDHWASGPDHLNAVQMILTLKLVGLAFEVHDSVQVERRLGHLLVQDNKKDDVSDKEMAEDKVSGDVKLDKEKEKQELRLFMRHRYVHPTPVDLFHYSFSHAGLLTGPYYKYRTFQDQHEAEYGQHADATAACLHRFSRLPLYVGLFLVFSHIFPLDIVEEDSFYETSSLFYRLFYMTPVFFNFRMRLYAGFVLSECSCIAAGLGAYPIDSKPKPGNGPTKLEVLDKIHEDKEDTKKEKVLYDFETVHNIDEYGAEFVGTMREALKTWNMTVQYWLATILYKRFPVKAVRTAVVMLVSSFWHGVHSGYYLSMGSVPLVLLVEDLYAKIVRRNLSEKAQAKYDWLSWFIRMQYFSYLGMAFQLLRIDATVRFWRSIGFAGHLLLPILYIIGIYFVKPLFNKPTAASKEIKKD